MSSGMLNSVFTLASHSRWLQSDSSYGDRILTVALINVLLFQEYPKLSQSYYALLEILAQDHMNFLSSLEPQVSSVVACEG